MSDVVYVFFSKGTELHLVIVFLYKDKIIKVKMREVLKKYLFHTFHMVTGSAEIY